MGQRSLLLVLLALLALKVLLGPPLLLRLLGPHVLRRPLLLLRSRCLREPGSWRVHSPLLLLWLQLLSLGGIRVGWLLLLVAVPDVKDALGFRL